MADGGGGGGDAVSLLLGLRCGSVVVLWCVSSIFGF